MLGILSHLRPLVADSCKLLGAISTTELPHPCYEEIVTTSGQLQRNQ